MDEPLAYFITWSCYGTWLHGDPRGSVDDRNNQLGEPPVERNSARLEFERSLLRTAPVVLAPGMRDVVDRVIRDHCGIRGWELLALNVRTTHAHVVVVAPGVAPEKVGGEFKAWSTRRLREAGFIGRDAPVWTRSASTRWLWDRAGVEGAVEYVLNRQ